MTGIAPRPLHRAQEAPNRARIRPRLRAFSRGEDGSLSIFSIFMVMSIILLGGIGADLMYNEIKRVRLQGTLDRAVLAAADLDQTLEPDEVVADYFLKAGLADSLKYVDVVEGLNHRTVSATADVAVKPLFLHMLGVEEMRANAGGAATERMSRVEISLVLDISGSMDDNNKLENLQFAAKEFIDTVVDDNGEDLVSVNLIPYSEHVNAGEELLEAVNTNKVHDHSYCVEFSDSEFGAVPIDTSITHAQAQHYQWNYYGNRTVFNPVCPDEDFEEIRPFSQSKYQLKNQIDDFEPRAGTSIFLGMKWAAAMLDPSFNTITRDLIDDGVVEASFTSRPASYSDNETLKTIVLMTDGMNDYSNRIAGWAYNSDSEYRHWSRYSLWYYLYNYVSYRDRGDYYYTKYTPSEGDDLLDDICDAVKAKGVTVWTIGFEVTDHGANVMESCASSPNHFFRVEGVEIANAFSAVASQINQLRLIQ